MEVKVTGTEKIEAPALYSSNIIGTFLKLIRSKYSFVDITELLGFAGMELYQVNDDGHWFTQDQVDRFYERLVELTRNPNIAREAGRYSASPENMSLINRYVLALIDPVKVFEIARTIAESYTRASRLESRKISGTTIEVTATPNAGAHEKKYQCENRIGYFEAIIYGLNYQLPKIEHSECIFNGAPACKYRISWSESSAKIIKRIRNGFPILAVPLLAVVFFLSPTFFPTFFGTTLFLFMSMVIASEYFEKLEYRISLSSLRSTTEKYFDNINLNYNNALMVNEIGRIISKESLIEAILSQVIETLQKRLDYDRGLIMLASADGKTLEYSTGYGYSESLVGELTDTRFHLDKKESKGIFVICYRDKRPFLVNDVDEIKEDLSERSLSFVKTLGSKSFICCPILYEDECLGVLAVDNMKSKRPLLESDMNLLMGIAPEIGISVHNALLTAEREEQFRSILRTLAASIDARDSLTAGHSEHVTEYCMAICREMTVPQEYTEIIRVAAQLHDYGKIGIKDSILKKSGPLSAREREEIKTHVVKTKEILDRINFKGIYKQVPEIAGAHHERMDGSGYPNKWKGEEIPLGSRIIAVADFFEAITAQRHYRDPMNLNEAINTLTAARGSHLDADVVDAFLSVLNRKET